MSFINIRKVPQEVLKTDGKASPRFSSVFNNSRGTLRMLMNDKSCLIPILKHHIYFKALIYSFSRTRTLHRKQESILFPFMSQNQQFWHNYVSTFTMSIKLNVPSSNYTHDLHCSSWFIHADLQCLPFWEQIATWSAANSIMQPSFEQIASHMVRHLEHAFDTWHKFDLWYQKWCYKQVLVSHADSQNKSIFQHIHLCLTL